MLTRRLDQLQADYRNTQQQLRELEADDTLSKGGHLYQDRRALILRKLTGLLTKMKTLGGGVEIVEVTGQIYLDNVLNSLYIKFTGISKEDALDITKLRYPTSFSVKATSYMAGKAIFRPVTEKTEKRGKI